MKKVLVAVVLTCTLLMSVSAFADGWTQKVTIQRVHIQQDNNGKAVCFVNTSKGQYAMQLNSPGGDKIYDILMKALQSKQKVHIFVVDKDKVSFTTGNVTARLQKIRGVTYD